MQNGYNYQQPNYQQINPYQQQNNGISGRSVSRVEDITVNDIPMDGTMSYFPLNSGMEIYGKRWNADGTVSTVLYKAELPKSDTEKEKEVNSIDQSINRLECQISALSEKLEEVKQIVSPKIRRKEVSADD